jgi:hypothetical protein
MVCKECFALVRVSIRPQRQIDWGSLSFESRKVIGAKSPAITFSPQTASFCIKAHWMLGLNQEPVSDNIRYMVRDELTYFP